MAAIEVTLNVREKGGGSNWSNAQEFTVDNNGNGKWNNSGYKYQYVNSDGTDVTSLDMNIGDTVTIKPGTYKEDGNGDYYYVKIYNVICLESSAADVEKFGDTDYSITNGDSGSAVITDNGDGEEKEHNDAFVTFVMASKDNQTWSSVMMCDPIIRNRDIPN